MHKRAITTIAKKEFFGFINSPLAYTIIVPFLLISVFLYLRMALVGGEASLRPYFELLPWFLILIAPALSMKLLTDEYKAHTIELLFAHPISELDIVFGKFLGALAFYAVILLTTIGLPITLLAYSNADFGQMVAQYAGALFVGATFMAVGLAASAYVKNAISSFLLSAAVSFMLILIGLEFVLSLTLFPFNRLFAELSVITHMQNVARGLIDIRDITYFLTITAVFLLAAVLKLSERKLAEDRAERQKLTTAFTLLLAIGIALNVLLSFYPVRLDVTADRLFTLSQGTKQTLKNLPDIITVTVYASRDLPAEMQLTARQVTDLLQDYKRLSTNVRVVIARPDVDQQAANDAQSAGIREITFNRIASGRYEAQSGFLGAAIRYGDQTESIPFIQDTTDLEYQITRRIRKLTSGKDTTIGIFTNSLEPAQALEQIISTQYKTETVGEGEPEKLKKLAALVVIDDGNKEGTASAMIKDYLAQNGKVLMLANGVAINTQSMSAQKSQSTLPSVLADYGITINNDLVYDRQTAQTLSFGQGQNRYLSDYPYWFSGLPKDTAFPPLAGIKSISVGWPSSLSLAQKPGVTIRQLLTTTQSGGKLTENLTINPKSVGTLPQNSRDTVLLAASSEKGATRIVAVGTGMIADEQFLQSNPNNIAFLASTVDWLVADKDLAAIPAKASGNAVFAFKRPQDLVIAQYGNLFLPPVVVVGFALFYLRRRRALTRRTYVQ